MKKYIFLFWISYLLIACNKDKCVRYLEIESQIINPLETYHIGDTIQFVSNFSKIRPGYDSEYNYLGNYDMSNYKWHPGTYIVQLDTSEFAATYIDKHFEFIRNPEYDYNLYKYSKGTSELGGEYTYKNDSFYLDFKVVTRKEGVFALFHNSGIQAGAFQQQDFSGKCGKYDGIDVYTIMKDTAKMNIQLLRLSPNNFYNSTLLDVVLFPNKGILYHQTMGIFCFRVVP